MKHTPPPRLAAWIARMLLTREDAGRLLAALEEEYSEHQRVTRGRTGADLWYWSQVLRSVPALRRGGTSERAGRFALILDLLHLGRRLRRSPVTAGAAALTLVATIGAGTAILAVADAALFQPPPFPEPERLLVVGEIPAQETRAIPGSVSFRRFGAWQDRAGPMARLEAFDPTTLTLTSFERPERVSANAVTTGFLDLLGLAPARGRLFLPEDRATRSVIISHGFRRQRLTGWTEVLGKRLMLDGQAYTIVGVLPESFLFGLNPAELWVPISLTPAEAAEGRDPVRVMARLAGDSFPESLIGALEEVGSGYIRGGAIGVQSLASAISGRSGRILGPLVGAAALALFLSVVNLALILLVRVADRREEFAIRKALGAPPKEEAWQLFLEVSALVGIGVIGGLLMAWWTTPLFARYALEFAEFGAQDIRVSGRAVGLVLFFMLLGTGLAVVPAHLTANRKGSAEEFRRGGKGSQRDLTFRRVFVSGEVALTFALMVSMFLLGTSLQDILEVDPGFRAEGLVRMQVSLPDGSYSTPEMVAGFYGSLQSRLRERLGSDAVSFIDEVPLTGDGGRAYVGTTPDDPRLEAVVRSAGEGYLEILRIPMVVGRSFGSSSEIHSLPRVVISESLAQRLFPSGSLLGRRIWISSLEAAAEIIGVCGDVKHRALGEPIMPTVYLPANQFPSASSILVIRTGGPLSSILAVAREELARIDPKLPIYQTGTMQELIDASPGVPGRKLLTLTLAGFAALSIALSLVGLFGVTAHEVTKRRFELAVRLVLGADSWGILRATLINAAVVVGIGVAAGGLLSFWALAVLNHFLDSVKYQVIAGTLAGATVLLSLICALAVLPVAYRAANTDPQIALREE